MERSYAPAEEAYVAVRSLFRLELAQALGEDVGAHVGKQARRSVKRLGPSSSSRSRRRNVRMVAMTESLRSGVLFQVHLFVL